MPFANNHGTKIYYEVEGQGPALLLAHGHGGSLTGWRGRGYTDALKDDFRLILFDARGHGRSDKPRDPDAYAILNMADDAVAILDDLGISLAHYFGFSMGSKIGYFLATHRAGRMRSFIFGSHTPYHDESDVKSREQIVERTRILLADPQAYIRRTEQLAGQPLPSWRRDELLANDALALLASTTAWDQITPLTDKELSLISVPCLVYCGDVDPYWAGARKAASHIPHARFVSLPGVDHMQGMVRSDLVLPHVKKFLAEVDS